MVPKKIVTVENRRIQDIVFALSWYKKTRDNMSSTPPIRGHKKLNSERAIL